ncbi:methyltransferase domain-containing protein (plasmid) [Paracoccus sp. TK19116]|uniref:Methyltransferase domain-containing protein n=1 Tax=Paracoccus albicereus TaxID=2922394 RepID=A0ABT1MMG1_9RHOB|nr:transcription antitermination factor NusB [Paracoccus albicereus]MCQ0969479.1 methyltransferase domain-containing protein [Paracoccus albicereus]
MREGASLGEQAPRLDHLPPGERARATRLAAEVLRYRGRADALIARHTNRRPRPDIADILRLATVEMRALGAAPHGAVNVAVDLVRGLGPKGRAAAGMVNAVLRKTAGDPGWDELPPQHLPDWLRAPVAAAWGDEATKAIEAAHQAGAPLDLTLKPGATPPEGAESLPTGSARMPVGAQVSALQGYDQGDWWVQDAAAAMAVRMLEPQPGERIVDLCAAPGGKTMQLAAAGAQVTAVDSSADRMERVAENLARTQLQATLITADALAWQPEHSLDAILLDAPCSATGTIRRHPDLPFIRDGEGIASIIELQGRLLDRALEILSPGGRLVYATCSLLPAEGEDQIAAALNRHPGLVVERPDMQGVDPAWWTLHGLRLRPDYWPDRQGMDGFFIARLRKPA